MDEDMELMRRMRRCGHLLYHQFSFNQSQNRLLLILYHSGAMPQKALMERMRIQPGSLSEVLGKVVNSGYVEKRRDAADRRTFELALTEKGIEQARAFERVQAETAAQLFACLDEKQKAALATTLEVLLASWEARCESDTGGENNHA